MSDWSLTPAQKWERWNEGIKYVCIDVEKQNCAVAVMESEERISDQLCFRARFNGWSLFTY
jgi:hypothetical protein